MLLAPLLIPPSLHSPRYRNPSSMAPVVDPDLDYFYPELGMKLNGGQYELLRNLGSGQYTVLNDMACH